MLHQIALLTLPLLFATSHQVHGQMYGESPTSTSSGASSGTSSSSASSSTSSVYDVDVGSANGSLIFSPDSLAAAMGSTINFHFYPRNHSVVQSSFDGPCVPSPDAIYSGFVPSAEGMADDMFTMIVNTADPLWLYCSQGKHCQSGMSMVVNAPPAEGGQTLAAYKAASAGVAMSQSPAGGVVGGQIAQTEGGGAAEGSGGSATSAVVASSASAAATSATSTGAAAGLIRPLDGAAGLAVCAVGLGVWTLL